MGALAAEGHRLPGACPPEEDLSGPSLHCQGPAGPESSRVQVRPTLVTLAGQCHSPTFQMRQRRLV